MTTRRSFFKQAGLGLAAAAGAPALSLRAEPAAGTAAAGRPDPFFIAAAGYTFHKFALEPTLEMLRKTDIRYLCIKDFHLPLNADAAAIAAFHETCRSFKVTGYGVGPINMSSEQEARDAFAYARRVGVKILVGVPHKRVENKRVASPELLKLINELVQEYDIQYAIHNHGPDMPECFPSAESCMALIAHLDKRVGICLDIGHEFRDNGKCPAQAMLNYADRIHDIHIKNVTAPDKSGRNIEMPRGVIDIPMFVRAMRQVGYSGACTLEYEKDMDAPLPGVAESIGYFRGVVDATRA